jgi:hypothetical protein
MKMIHDPYILFDAIYIAFSVYIIFVCRCEDRPFESPTATLMLHSQQILRSDAHLDEATILSAMFAEPKEASASVNIEMTCMKPVLATQFPLSGVVKEDCSEHDESRLLQPGLVDGFWSPIRDDYVERVSFLPEGDGVRFKLVPTIWQCVKNAFSMPLP